MKQLFTALVVLLISGAYAQKYEAPRLGKTAIGNSGCFAYLPEGELEVKTEYSPDSSVVYSGEIIHGDHHFAAIVVKLNGTVLETEDEKYDLLVSYLDFLQTQFNIVGSAGYGKGHTLEKFPDAVGIIDYWVDTDEDEWAIKGWVDSNTMGILMIYGAGEYPNFNVQSLYLDSFRFY